MKLYLTHLKIRTLKWHTHIPTLYVCGWIYVCMYISKRTQLTKLTIYTFLPNYTSLTIIHGLKLQHLSLIFLYIYQFTHT